MSHAPRVTDAQTPWALPEGEQSQTLAPTDDFFELCAEVARQHQLLPSMFHSLVLETKLCPPTTIGAPEVFSTLQAGATALSRLLKNAGGNYQESSHLFLIWAAEFLTRTDHGPNSQTKNDTCNRPNADEPSSTQTQKLFATGATELQFHPKSPLGREDASDFFSETINMAQAAIDVAGHVLLSRDIVLGVVWYRRTLIEHTPPLPQGNYRKEGMLVPMNIPAMFGRLEQIHGQYPSTYEAINLRFLEKYSIPIVDLNPSDALQNLTSAAIDIALILHLHHCNIASALSRFSRLEKATAIAFANNVLQAAHEISHGHQSLSRHLWG